MLISLHMLAYVSSYTAPIAVPACGSSSPGGQAAARMSALSTIDRPLSGIADPPVRVWTGISAALSPPAIFRTDFRPLRPKAPWRAIG